MEQLQAWREANPPRPRPKPPMKINWHLVLGIVFGFFVWYVGVAMLAHALKQPVKSCCPAFPSHFEP